jgi:hypothetical protein
LVDELPPHVGGRGHSVDLDHVVFPLDSLGGVVTVGLALLMMLRMMAARGITRVFGVLLVSVGVVACVRAVMLVAVPVVTMPAVLLVCFALVLNTVVTVAVVVFVLVLVVAVSVVVLVAVTTSACDQVRRQELHAALGAAVGLLACDLRMHGAHVGGLFCRLGEQLHSALRAAAGLVADHLGVHRAGINDRDAFGHAHIHLGDERERLLGRRGQ